MRRCTGLLVAVTAAACAQYGAPPGGERDQRPPQVLETTPAPFAVVPDFSGPVVIRFDERLSEQGADAAIVVSPLTGDVRVERDGEVLRVSIEGGWRPGQIYRIVVLPVLRDLFGNQRREPGELVFSTGPPIPATALAGTVTERITGQPPQRAVVHAVRRFDSTVYVTPAGADGFYAMLNLPNGTYDLIGFADPNQNWQRDPNEPASRTAAVSLASDTITTDVAILPVDTTAAQVQSAAQQDTVFRVQLDDYIESGGLAAASARLYTLPDTTLFPVALQLLADAEYRPAPAPVVDTLGVPADTAAVAPTDTITPPPVEPDNAQPVVALPGRTVVVVPATLPPPGEYVIELQGVANINGIGGGGGRAPLRITLPTPDTPAVPADTPGAQPDTVPPPRL